MIEQRPPIQDKIISYAFQNDCDLDKAAYTVLSGIIYDVSMNHNFNGFYDRLFIKQPQKEEK